MKRRTKTTKKQIAEYWIENNTVSELDLHFDWCDAEDWCWNCASVKGIHLERCHIIPHSLGGEDTPSNYVLLCKDCHAEAPNTTNPKDMWDFLKSNKLPIMFYGMYPIYKGLKHFEEKEGYSFYALNVKNIKDLQNDLSNGFKDISFHKTKINYMTYYYLFKSVANKYNN